MLPRGWKAVRVEDVAGKHASALSTGPFGSAISARFFVARGVPVIRGSNLSEDVGIRLNDDGLVFVSVEKAQEFRRSMVQRGDLVFTCWGTIGQVGLIDARATFDRYVISNKQMKLTPDPSIADSAFLYYAFSSPQIMASIQAQAIGSSVPGFNLGQLKAVSIPLPSLSEQRRIAAVLGVLDDKIDLNRQMNRTLEEMAQVIFMSWFIDFDGHTDLVDSELGPIPRGWRVGSLGDVVAHVRDGVDPSAISPETPYVGLEHIPRKCAALDTWGTSADVESGKSKFKQGDVLFGKLRPYFHKVVIAPLDGVCSTDVLVLRPKSPGWFGFAFGHLFSTAIVDHASAMADGTKMPRTSWADLNRYKFALPPEPVATRLDGIVRPVFERIHCNVFESKSLAALRDALLPKLISGEIRVPEAESIVTEAT